MSRPRALSSGAKGAVVHEELAGLPRGELDIRDVFSQVAVAGHEQVQIAVGVHIAPSGRRAAMGQPREPMGLARLDEPTAPVVQQQRIG
ncbi:MAG: hypothetical protein ACI8PZ_007000 [Myxococcota bacterium]|jgi:hypothetical protein